MRNLVYNETPMEGDPMSTAVKIVKRTELEIARDEALKVLHDLDPTDPQYHKTLEAVEKLSNLMHQERHERVSINTILQVAGTVLSVGMIVGHERAHILTSKALMFLPKLLK